MAKRDRDGNRSGATRGGIRQTRSVSRHFDGSGRNFRPFDYTAGFELDLSAFEDTHEGPTRFEREAVARAQDIARPGRTISMQNRKRPEGSALGESKRAKPRGIKTTASRLSQSGGLKDNQPARTEHLHAERSEQRKERSRAVNCKQRPEPTKGRGSGRKFVPWCDRKR